MQEMRVGPLVVHVLDAAFGLVVLGRRRAAASLPIQWVSRPLWVSRGAASPRMRLKEIWP